MYGLFIHVSNTYYMLSDEDKIFSYRELREEKEKQAVITIWKKDMVLLWKE